MFSQLQEACFPSKINENKINVILFIGQKIYFLWTEFLSPTVKNQVLWFQRILYLLSDVSVEFLFRTQPYISVLLIAKFKIRFVLKEIYLN